MDFAASYDPSMGRYDVMLASIKELEEEGSPARVEYQPRTLPGMPQQGTPPRPSSAHASSTVHSSQGVALTYSSQDAAVATGGRVFSARPQSASATYAAQGSNPRLADPRQVLFCYSHV